MKTEELSVDLLKAVKTGFGFYDRILANEFVCHNPLLLNCDDLVEPEPSEKFKYGLPEIVKVNFFRAFDVLDARMNEKPCLYIFEFEGVTPREIIDCYKTVVGRNKSAFKQNNISDSNVLYVGKVKKGVGGRLATHFGYANPNTAGLQLRFWAKEINLKLKIHLISFNDSIDNFINPLELELAKQLKPVIGKSR